MESWSEKITRAIGSSTSLVVHTLLFIGAFVLPFFGASFDRVLLVLTTIVSLEAIYLALFIQMTVNRHTESLEDLEEDIDEIGEDIDDISEDLEEAQEEIGEMREEDLEEEYRGSADPILLDIQKNVARIMEEIETLKKR
jgi:low affinity Fe/Cu permease